MPKAFGSSLKSSDAVAGVASSTASVPKNSVSASVMVSLTASLLSVSGNWSKYSNVGSFGVPAASHSPRTIRSIDAITRLRTAVS